MSARLRAALAGLSLASAHSGCADDRSGRRPGPAAPTELPAPAGWADADALVAEAREVLARRVDPARFGDPGAYEVVAATDEGELGHVRFRQMHRGVPVWGGEIGVHLRPGGAVRAVVDRLVPDLRVDPVPTIDGDEAFRRAGGRRAAPPEDWGLALRDPPPPALRALRRPDGDHLAWQVDWSDLAASPPTAPRVFVDAGSGEIVWSYDNLQTDALATETLYDGPQTTELFASGPSWYPDDRTPRHYQTLSAEYTTTSLYYPESTVLPYPDAILGGLHYGAAMALDYFADQHGRDGLDGADGPVWLPRVGDGVETFAVVGHYGLFYDNAFWDPVNWIVAAGDGFYLDPFVSLDVVGHELTHGVVSYSADLTYQDEPGALNESWADVFGAAVERHARGQSATTWDIGEDIVGITGWAALRFMDDPTADGSPQRDHYDERYTGTADNGGVHWNSGIGNLAFYLTSEGGNHPDPAHAGIPVVGVGFDAAAAVWYRALTVYLLSSSDFADARFATLLAAEDLYGTGSDEALAVDAAWALVGVDPWIVLPGPGWTAGGVGAPAIAAANGGGAVLAFESQVAAPDATCPHGTWSIGFATSADGEAWTVAGAAALAPTPGTWRSCVVAHPALVPDPSGGYHLWFKAEQDAGVCGDEEACLYRGFGYAHLTDALAVDAVSAAPVLDLAEASGFPSVVDDGGTWRMAYQVWPEVRFATAPAAAGPWTPHAGSEILPGTTSWTDDELFSPALACGPAGLTAWIGGRDTTDAFGPVLDGGVGLATSPDGTSWSLSPSLTHGFAGDSRWRHWSVGTVTGGAVLVYSELVGGVSRIGLRTDLGDADWDPGSLAGRACP